MESCKDKFTYHREHYNASKHGCEAVSERDHDRISVAVVIDRVVG